MIKLKFVFVLIVISFFVSCKQSDILKITLLTSSHFNTVTKALHYPDGYPYTSEISGVAVLGNRIIMANDKFHPEASPVLESILIGNTADSTVTEIYSDAFSKIKKIEDLALTLDKKYILYMAAFNDTASFSNQILFASTDSVQNAKFVKFESNGINQTLRDAILNAVSSKNSKVTYIKIEGMTIIPGNKILLGIRELGNSYTDFEYAGILLEIPYLIVNNEFILKDEIKIHYKAEVSKFEESPFTGLSGLEYEPENNRLYALFSFEKGIQTSDLGGFLYSASLDEISTTGLKPVFGSNNKIYKFTHKPEGISAIDKNRFLVVYDDDRVTGSDSTGLAPVIFKRTIYRSVYSIIEIK